MLSHSLKKGGFISKVFVGYAQFSTYYQDGEFIRKTLNKRENSEYTDIIGEEQDFIQYMQKYNIDDFYSLEKYI